MLPAWLITAWPKVLEYLKKVGTWFGVKTKDRAEKNYFVYENMKSLGAEPKDESFNTLYNAALYRFDHNYAKHPLLIKLFNERSVRNAFLEAESKNISAGLLDELNATISTKAKYEEMRDFQIDLSREVEQLMDLYHSVVREKRKPVEAQNQRDLLDSFQKILAGGVGQPKDTIDLSDTISDLDGLLKDKRHFAAIDLLLKFREKDWEKRSVEIKYKISAKLGLAYFQMHDRQNAAKYLIELLDFHINLKDTYGYVALGFSLIDRPEEATRYAKMALDLDSSSVNAHLALLYVQENSEREDVSFPEIPESLKDNEGIRLNMAIMLQKKRDFAGARKMIEEINENHKENDYFKAEILNRLVQVIFESQPSLHFQRESAAGSAVKAELEYAKEKLTEAWDIVKDTDLRKSRWYIVYHRGVVERLLGMKQEAEVDFWETISLHPFAPAYRQYWHIVADDKDKRARVIRDLEKLQLSKEDSQELLLMKAENAYDLEMPGDYVIRLQETLPHVETYELKMHYFEAIINLLMMDKDFVRAEEVAQSLVALLPDSPYGHLFLGKISMMTGNISSSNSHYMNAADLVDTGKNRIFADETAKGLIHAGNAQAAVEMLDRVADKEVLDILTRLLASALYQAGRDRAAFDLATKLLAANPGDLHLIEIVATIYEKEGKYAEGITFLKEAIRHASETSYLNLKLAMVYYKNGQLADTVDASRHVTDLEKYPLNLQFMIADAFVRSGLEDEGLERAYRLRNAHIGERDAHTFYIQVILGAVKPPEYHAPPQVQKDTAVELDGGGRKTTIIIVEDPKYALEVGLEEAVSMALMGKAVNDEVVISGLKYHIRSIIAKYTYAMHESMDLIPVKFGNEGSLRVGRFEPEGDPTENLRQLLLSFTPPPTPDDPDLDDIIAKLETVYKNGILTLGTRAILYHDNIINFWRRVIHDQEQGIYSNGYGDEAAAAVGSIKSVEGIVLDIIGIMTIHVAGVLDIVRMTKNKWIVTRSTWQLLENEIERLSERSGETSLSVDFVGENLFKIEITPEEKKTHIERLTKLKSELSAFVTIIEPSLSEDFAKKSELDSILGRSFNDSIELAKERNFILYSDDAVLRTIAAEKFGLRGAGTLALLVFAQSETLIDQNRMEEVHIRLIRLNYRQIPVNPTIMMRVLKEAQFSVQFPFTHATDLIDSRLLLDKPAVLLVVGFLYLLYQELTIRESKILVLQFVLGRLFAGRDLGLVRPFLVACLRVKFHLLPLQLREIMSELELYA